MSQATLNAPEPQTAPESDRPRAAAHAAPRPEAPRKLWLISGGISVLAVALMMTPAIYAWFAEGRVASGGAGGATASAQARPAGPAVDAAAAARGRILFAQGCNACHGDDARGRPGLGKDLARNPFVAAQSDAGMVAFLKRGRDATDPLNTTRIPMPPKGGNPALNDKHLADLTAFLRGLQG